MGETIRRSFIGTWMGENSELGMYVDDIKKAGNKQNMARMRKKLMKNVDIDEPTSFIDHVYLICTQHKFLEVELLSHSVGCARNKLLFRTVTCS